jgi:hypothetical protein
MPGIKIDLLGNKEIEEKLEKLPTEVADLAIGDVQDYMLNVLKSDQPPPKLVTRKAAYGVSAFSEKQRRYLGYLYSTGQVPYHRTQAMSRGWHLVKGQRGLFGYIVNYTPGISYVIGERNQSRHEALVGWKKVSQQLKDRAEKISRIIDEAAKKALKKLKLT